MPHVRNNTYRLLRLVEEMVLDGKSGEKEQELMHKRQETYEKRLKIQYQQQYCMESTEPDTYFQFVEKLVRGMSKETIGKSNISDSKKKKMWQTILKIAEEYADYVVPETCDANVEKFYDKESDEVILLSPPVGTPKQRKSGRKRTPKKIFSATRVKTTRQKAQTKEIRSKKDPEENLLAQRHG